MELWIRSQDRERLSKVENLELFYKNDNDSTKIYNYIDHATQYLLGEYETKERALEVLKEINDIKFYKYIANFNFDNFINAIQKYSDEEQKELLLKMNTYEMPKK